MRLKRFSALILSMLCIFFGFAGCGDKTPEQEPQKIQTPYKEEDLETMLFYEKERGVTVDISANGYLKELLLGVEYYAAGAPSCVQGAGDLQEPLFVLTLGEKTVEVYSKVSVCFVVGGAEEWAAALNGELEYLTAVLVGEERALDGYAEADEIGVKNAEGASGTVTDKAKFLENLGAVGIVKLGNKENYTLGAGEYTLQIGADELIVYQKYVVVNGDLYGVTQGNFDFLKGLNYGSSSGWLPWL